MANRSQELYRQQDDAMAMAKKVNPEYDRAEANRILINAEKIAFYIECDSRGLTSDEYHQVKGGDLFIKDGDRGRIMDELNLGTGAPKLYEYFGLTSGQSVLSHAYSFPYQGGLNPISTTFHVWEKNQESVKEPSATQK